MKQEVVEKLLEKHKQGNPDALGDIIKLCEPIVKSLAGKYYKYGKDRYEFTDLCQMGYLAIIENVDKYNGTCSFSTFVYITAKHVIYLAVNDGKESESIEEYDDLEDMRSRGYMDAINLREETCQYLKDLESYEAALLLDYFGYTLSKKEVCAKYHMSDKTLKQNVQEILRKIRYNCME